MPLSAEKKALGQFLREEGQGGLPESKSCNYVSKPITYRITKKACMAELSGGAKRCCIF